MNFRNDSQFKLNIMIDYKSVNWKIIYLNENDFFQASEHVKYL